MKLLTHNLLSSPVKGVANGFPLTIEATKVVTEETEFNPDFVANLITDCKLEWAALRAAATSISAGDLPEELPDNATQNEDLLRLMHHVLLEVVVMEGALVCPESGRRFPINDGIPNMLLNEDEV